MLLLQFSTSHYCRKARLALGYQGIDYRVKNLTPGLHALQLRPLTGTTTVPVLCPEMPGKPEYISDSSAIFRFLEKISPDRRLFPLDPEQRLKAEWLEDWLDESIGTATRFVYYDYRAGEGKAIDPSFTSQLVIKIVRRQYNINPTTVALAKQRLELAFQVLGIWQDEEYLCGNHLTVADLTAAALLSPLALLPEYQQSVPWLFERIKEIHLICGETLPPGLT
ncbi:MULTISPECIES: glutathione S-transferase family protein [unclassified Synechocystis]|uniref:glutathione S-transferase family protein n=1 Tax=unclassified Synechocystis TaxID=2640012 RepID=UPI000491CA7F|nr:MULTISPECIES: glutathione S-transferase family protein [unclassified Synechocystis]AIE75101.1 Glutathione S-transferase family protein [Synechocystis sp. PCC 6714]MCT0253201.1 glutathione S-transferase family protein [Synechocystis sp. CS-94]